jgi:hemoglobin
MGWPISTWSTKTMTEKSLFERLGGTEGITRITSDLVDNHLANPAIATRFAGADVTALKNGAATFVIAGTGGPDVYRGKDMRSVHKGMNASAVEYMAVMDDALAALQKNDVGKREQEELLYIIYSFRSDIVLV